MLWSLMPTGIRLSLRQSRNYRSIGSCFLRCVHIIPDWWEKVILQESVLFTNARMPRWKRPKVSWQCLETTLILCARI
uniref:Uncharacterized protein n=1 Tax=Arundo donax TaxID=35708 RepID=A0A0A9D9B2_ARUDO